MTSSVARDILARAGVGSTPKVALLKKHNHVYRIETPEASFHLKTYTKSWYSPEPSETRGCVVHEAAAFRILAARGVMAPRVRLADETCDNPLKRPFLLLETLAGRSLTSVLQSPDSRGEFGAVLVAVGRYMAQLHAITFRFPGYLIDGAPAAPPGPDEWQHPCWTAEAFKALALKTWETDGQIATSDLLERAKRFYREQEEALRSEYRPPRFTHGDCHAHQFFLARADGDWTVTGVVDMEVASAGDCACDFVKLGLELAGTFPAREWWRPILAGYGRELAFEPMKLRFAASAYDAEYLGQNNWPGTRAARLAHILDSRDWRSLFDLRRLKSR